MQRGRIRETWSRDEVCGLALVLDATAHAHDAASRSIMEPDPVLRISPKSGGNVVLINAIAWACQIVAPAEA